MQIQFTQNNSMNLRLIFILCIASLFAGCATYAGLNFDQLFGPQLVRERTASVETPQADFFQREVKPIVDNRCVVLPRLLRCAMSAKTLICRRDRPRSIESIGL